MLKLPQLIRRQHLKIRQFNHFIFLNGAHQKVSEQVVFKNSVVHSNRYDLQQGAQQNRSMPSVVKNYAPLLRGKEDFTHFKM